MFVWERSLTIRHNWRISVGVQLVHPNFQAWVSGVLAISTISVLLRADAPPITCMQFIIAPTDRPTFGQENIEIKRSNAQFGEGYSIHRKANYVNIFISECGLRVCLCVDAFVY